MSDPAFPTAPSPLSLPGVPLPRLGDRSSFPDLRSAAYLAHAAISPASLATAGMVKACVGSVAELGVGSFPIWMTQRERLREGAAALVGVAPESIGLTAGCTPGIIDLALSLPWKSGDTLLTYSGEFPANVNPWQLAAQAHGGTVELLELPSATDDDCAARLLQDLEDRLAKPDAIPWVAVSAVQFQTGLRMPMAAMAEICHRHGARLFVDGIQACGVVPLDLQDLKIDAFFTGAHKWLLGLEGAGFSYFAPDLMERLTPVTAGWMSYPESEYFLFRGAGHLRYDRELLKGPRVFEGSTSAAIAFAALEAGVSMLRHLGAEAIYDHAQSYHDAIEGGLVDLGLTSLRARDPELRSCTLSFRPGPMIEVPALAASLRTRGVTISTPDGLIRLAPHFANSLDEVPLVLDAFREALAG